MDQTKEISEHMGVRVVNKSHQGMVPTRHASFASTDSDLVARQHHPFYEETKNADTAQL